MANYNLTNQDISQSFQQILQKNDDNGYLVNGTGSIVEGLTVSGSLSASYFVGDGSGLTNLTLPSGIVSSSEQLPAGLVSGSSQVSYTGLSNIPSGIVSSSSQIILQDTTGNLSGSRIDGLVLSSSFAISASHSELADLATLATNATYAQNTITTGKNLHNTTIAKGTPLFFTGSGTAGNLVGVYPADAGNPDRMPAGGVAGESLAVGAEGIVLLDGYIGGVDTSLFSSGDEVFVAVGGGYTNVAPTGSALIQHLGNVEKSAVNGSGVIQMMGEVRGLPNIQQGYAWVGDSNGVPQAVSTGSWGGGGTPIDTGSFATTGSNVFTSEQTVIGDVTISGSNHLFIQRSPTGAQQYLRLGPTDNEFNFAFIVTGSDQQPGQQVWGINVQGGTWQNGFDAPTGFQNFTTFRSGIDILFGGGQPNSRMGVNHTSGSTQVYTGLSQDGMYVISSSVDDRIVQINPTDGTFTASLQQGYAWVGDSNGKSISVPTGSFGGGGSGFPYVGDAQITGSLSVSNTVTSQIFLNPQVLTGTQSVPSGFNGMLTGPVSNAGTIVVESGSTLVII